MGIRRSYETTYIINAVLEDAEIEAVIQRVNSFITDQGGKIVEENQWADGVWPILSRRSTMASMFTLFLN